MGGMQSAYTSLGSSKNVLVPDIIFSQINLRICLRGEKYISMIKHLFSLAQCLEN